MPKKVVTVNPKGGVGKSTTVVGGALALVEKNYSVCVVDIDDQGSSSGSLVDLDNAPVHSSAFALMNGADDFKPQFVSDRLAVAHASLDLLDIDSESIDPEMYYQLKDSIDEKLSDFDFVIIDTPGTLKARVIAALVAADYVYTPIELSDYSIKAVRNLSTLMTKVRKRMNHGLNFIGYLPNRVHGQRLKQPIRVDERNIYNNLVDSVGQKAVLPIITELKFIRTSSEKGISLSGYSGEDAASARLELGAFADASVDAAQGN